MTSSVPGFQSPALNGRGRALNIGILGRKGGSAKSTTAYNLAAGGPIVTLGVDAVAVTPICPHSLSFRPVMVPMTSTIKIRPTKVNPGTTLFCDGQDSTPLRVGDEIAIARADHDVLLYENPHSNFWQALAEKLNWALGPQYNHEGAE